MDRGRGLLSRTVTAAFDLLDATVENLPAYTPHLKGTAEGLNRAVEGMFLAALPDYARQPRPGDRLSRSNIEHGLTSGTMDAWLAPWQQENDQQEPLLHVTGHWARNV
ncbi:hypothetical protein [Streptomyces sp. NPDC090057]|uniref:hypothetical protein n=1 Tax=Streptomyces sp. NPDC090057 TaxID=3365935 RepID=UPI0037FA001F